MPITTIRLLSLRQGTSTHDFLTTLQSSPLRILVISRVIRWVFAPKELDVESLLHPPQPWDFLLITQNNSNGSSAPDAAPSSLPENLQEMIANSWTTTAGVPSRLTNDFATRNQKLLHPNKTSSLQNPQPNSSSSQGLELHPDLPSWIIAFSKTHAGCNAVSMFNLLAFKSGMKDSYLAYGKAFAKSIGSRRGGDAKLVGNLVKSSSNTSDPTWNEYALAHYPSITHFADMYNSQDYQAANSEYRVPALRDTCILCTSEIAVEEILAGRGDMETGAAMRREGSKL